MTHLWQCLICYKVTLIIVIMIVLRNMQCVEYVELVSQIICIIQEHLQKSLSTLRLKNLTPHWQNGRWFVTWLSARAKNSTIDNAKHVEKRSLLIKVFEEWFQKQNRSNANIHYLSLFETKIAHAVLHVLPRKDSVTHKCRLVCGNCKTSCHSVHKSRIDLANHIYEKHILIFSCSREYIFDCKL